MIIIEKETMVDIPTLHVVEAELKDLSDIPTVFFLHGFTRAKEHNLHVAYLLAEQGIRVILPDALHHGERENDVSKNEKKLALSFWEIVLTSIGELSALKELLVESGRADKNRIGVIGTSMGAITTLGALSQYPWIKTAVSLMGTAYYQQFAKAQVDMMEKQGAPIDERMKELVLSKLQPFDLSSQLEKLASKPLLIWHGKQDQVVPSYFSEQLYQSLQQQYQQTPEHIKLIVEEKTGHKVSRQAVLQAVQWFDQHLIKEKQSAIS